MLEWYGKSGRDLPWRRTKDPYKIWLSEVILQQTRIQQGLPYYERFIDQFPTVYDLARAEEDQILRSWQGLGYYSRARNMHRTAKLIVDQYAGIFPGSYEELLTLPGIGRYTAAAISSFCFDQPQPVIDGNVYRIVSRVFGLETDISNSSAFNKFRSILLDIIPLHSPGNFNQAIMEKGSTVCLPKKPLCDLCTIRDHCHAFKHKLQQMFPVKTKKIKQKKRFFNYYMIEFQGLYALKRRNGNDVWKGLYEFMLIEQEEPPIPEELFGEHFNADGEFSNFRHLLTHQEILAKLFIIRLQDIETFERIMNKWELKPYSYEQILTLPKSQLIVNMLNKADLNGKMN